MNHLLDDDDDGRATEREITLSTTSVLGIFFGLALVCALFFGFGYNMGRKSVPPAAASADSSGNTGSAINFSAIKPAAGSPVSDAQPGSAATAPPTAPSASTAVVNAPPAVSSMPAAASVPSDDQPGPQMAQPAVSAALGHAAPIAAPAATGSFIVQIAAVSHQEDADLLVGALKQRGYSVSARMMPQDKLIHIQVGPFNNRKDADAMRQRLLADGYNAIVK